MRRAGFSSASAALRGAPKLRVTTEASSRSVDVTYFFCGEMPAPETLGQDLQGRDVVGIRAGRVINRFKVSKFFVLEFEDARFRYRIDEAAVSREAELDGIYVIRTNVPAERLDAAECVRTLRRTSHWPCGT